MNNRITYQTFVFMARIYNTARAVITGRLPLSRITNAGVKPRVIASKPAKQEKKATATNAIPSMHGYNKTGMHAGVPRPASASPFVADKKELRGIITTPSLLQAVQGAGITAEANDKLSLAQQILDKGITAQLPDYSKLVGVYAKPSTSTVPVKQETESALVEIKIRPNALLNDNTELDSDSQKLLEQRQASPVSPGKKGRVNFNSSVSEASATVYSDEPTLEEPKFRNFAHYFEDQCEKAYQKLETVSDDIIASRTLLRAWHQDPEFSQDQVEEVELLLEDIKGQLESLTGWLMTEFDGDPLTDEQIARLESFAGDIDLLNGQTAALKAEFENLKYS